MATAAADAVSPSELRMEVSAVHKARHKGVSTPAARATSAKSSRDAAVGPR
jgi:hypothetical protein